MKIRTDTFAFRSKIQHYAGELHHTFKRNSTETNKTESIDEMFTKIRTQHHLADRAHTPFNRTHHVQLYDDMRTSLKNYVAKTSMAGPRRQNKCFKIDKHLLLKALIRAISKCWGRTTGTMGQALGVQDWVFKSFLPINVHQFAQKASKYDKATLCFYGNWVKQRLSGQFDPITAFELQQKKVLGQTIVFICSQSRDGYSMQVRRLHWVESGIDGDIMNVESSRLRTIDTATNRNSNIKLCRTRKVDAVRRSTKSLAIWCNF